WRVGAELALLLLVAASVALALWPALRADPVGTAQAVIAFGRATGGVPHENGDFFLGTPVRNPGPTFYPVVLAFRLSPLVVLGLALWLADRIARRGAAPPLLHDPALWLLLGAAVVVVVMGAAAKKLDRYVLPAVPLLAIVAAVGYARAARVLRRAELRALALGALGLVQFGLCAGERPYYFTAYSPLLGGAPAAPRALPVGWGEGLDLVAAYLEQADDPGDTTIAAADRVRSTFGAQVSARVLKTSARPDWDFLLEYVLADQVGQRGQDVAPGQLVLTVRLD